MTAHAKFMFETVFAGADDIMEPQAPPEPEAEFTRAELDEARQSAFQSGLRTGREKGLAEASADLDQKIANIQRQVHQITGQLAAMRAELAVEAAQLALASVRTLVPALVAREPQAELEALFAECVGHLRNVPHLVVRVPPCDLEALRARLERMALEGGFDGRLIILQEDDLGAGDCRIEWAEGGITHDVAAMYDTLARIVARHAGARQRAASGEGA